MLSKVLKRAGRSRFICNWKRDAMNRQTQRNSNETCREDERKDADVYCQRHHWTVKGKGL